jgi:hypothetical protein
MKKYAYIALTTTLTLSTTCMELQLKKRHNIQDKSSIALPADSKLFSFNTLNALVQTPSYSAPSFAESFGGHSEATKDRSSNTPTVYRKYTDLDFVPVYVYTNSNEIELTPIYKPINGSSTEYLDCITNTKKTIPQEEQKLNNTYLIERLHNTARDFLDYIDSTMLKKPYHTEKFTQSKNKHQALDTAIRNKKLITVIKLMNAAKHNGITEDFMGNFSYEKYQKITHPYAVDAFTPFVFSYLKKYMLTLRDSEEKLALSTDNLSSPHPAYDKLIQNIIKVFESSTYIAIPYLYASEKILSEKQEQYTHISNLNECFETLVFICLQRGGYYRHNLYDLLNLIEHIKKSKNIKREKDLGHAILALEKQQSLKEKFFGYPEHDYSIYHKNYIAMFCIYIKWYQQARGNKVTPLPIQSLIQNIKKNRNIALPDSFNTNLLDENYYALKEFNQLLKSYENLHKTNAADLQELVDQHYIFNEKDEKEQL